MSPYLVVLSTCCHLELQLHPRIMTLPCLYLGLRHFTASTCNQIRHHLGCVVLPKRLKDDNRSKREHIVPRNVEPSIAVHRYRQDSDRIDDNETESLSFVAKNAGCITNTIISHKYQQNIVLSNRKYRCHGLSVYAVCVCNKVRLPGTGQSAHVIGGSRFTRTASNSRRTLLN